MVGNRVSHPVMEDVFRSKVLIPHCKKYSILYNTYGYKIKSFHKKKLFKKASFFKSIGGASWQIGSAAGRKPQLLGQGLAGCQGRLSLLQRPDFMLA